MKSSISKSYEHSLIVELYVSVNALLGSFYYYKLYYPEVDVIFFFGGKIIFPVFYKKRLRPVLFTVTFKMAEGGFVVFYVVFVLFYQVEFVEFEIA